jgi:hypothetical protein
VNAHPLSEIIGELAVKTPKLLTVSANANYNTYSNRLSSSSESVAYKGETVQFDMTHQYLRDPRTQFLITGLGLKLDRWDLKGQMWRDVENRIITQREYKVHYASQCWGVGFSYMNKPGETQYLVLLDLKGLGGMKF